MKIQLSFFDSIMDLLCIKPIFLLGFILVGISLFWCFIKNNELPKVRITICSIIMYYYLCLMLKNIVGIPDISELSRLSNLGESFFNPNINLIPLNDCFGLSFILNIILFVPLGFLSPIISRTYEQSKKVILFGFSLSLIIEISQLFTLYRATDINDLLTNSLGTLIGYLCYRTVMKLKIVKSCLEHKVSLENKITAFLPIMIMVFAFISTFIS